MPVQLVQPLEGGSAFWHAAGVLGGSDAVPALMALLELLQNGVHVAVARNLRPRRHFRNNFSKTTISTTGLPDGEMILDKNRLNLG